MMKKPYSKPFIKPVKWDFRDAICNTVISNSFCRCITINKGSMVNQVEIRADQTGEWNRVGSISGDSW